jgi:uncharacterized membrane protein YoaK (UPF0700 family)
MKRYSKLLWFRASNTGNSGFGKMSAMFTSGQRGNILLYVVEIHHGEQRLQRDHSTQFSLLYCPVPRLEGRLDVTRFDTVFVVYMYFKFFQLVFQQILIILY